MIIGPSLISKKPFKSGLSSPYSTEIEVDTIWQWCGQTSLSTGSRDQATNVVNDIWRKKINQFLFH